MAGQVGAARAVGSAFAKAAARQDGFRFSGTNLVPGIGISDWQLPITDLKCCSLTWERGLQVAG
jgi:hypothetical protein